MKRVMLIKVKSKLNILEIILSYFRTFTINSIIVIILLTNVHLRMIQFILIKYYPPKCFINYITIDCKPVSEVYKILLFVKFSFLLGYLSKKYSNNNLPFTGFETLNNAIA